MKKLLSLTLALVLSLSLCIPAFAVEQSGRVEHVYDLGDGIIAIVGVEPVDDTGIMPCVNFSGVASPTEVIPMSMLPSDGNFLDVRVWNDEAKNSGINMEVTFKVTANGKTMTLPAQVVEPASRGYTQIQSTNCEGLTAHVVTTIKAIDTPSVRYTFVFSPEEK